MKLFRKLGIPAMVFAGALALFSPSPANARGRHHYHHYYHHHHDYRR
jgi:hypothetical protein